MENKLPLPRPLWLLLALVLLAITGCGAATGDVTGTVSYQGKTLTSGTVIIAGSDSLTYYGAIQEDGAYLVSKVPVGLAKITVASPDPADDNVAMHSRMAKSTKPSAPAPMPGDPVKWFPIPDEYRHFDKTKLTVTVTGGVNQRDIPLD